MQKTQLYFIPTLHFNFGFKFGHSWKCVVWSIWYKPGIPSVSRTSPEAGRTSPAVSRSPTPTPPILVWLQKLCHVLGRGPWSRTRFSLWLPHATQSLGNVGDLSTRRQTLEMFALSFHKLLECFHVQFGSGPFSHRHTISKLSLDFLPVPTPWIFIWLKKW